MNSARCNSCGLVNHALDPFCRRCGKVLPARPIASHGPPSTRELASRGFPFFSILIVVAFAAFAIYLYRSIQNEMGQIEATEANRIATQPTPEPAGLSRTDYDRQRSGQYGNAMKHNPDLAAANNRTAETQKLMQSVSQPQNR